MAESGRGTNGPAVAEQYVGECMVKCAQCVLSSRIFDPALRTATPDRRRSRWFLLELDEVEAARPALDACKRNVTTPLSIEVHLEAQADGMLLPGAYEASLHDPLLNHQHVLLERWVLQYGPALLPGATSGGGGVSLRTGSMMVGGVGGSSGSSGGLSGGSTRSVVDEAPMYKRMTLLVRALYSHLRMLPAYRLYRAAKRCATAQAPPTAWRVVYTLRSGHTVVGGSSSIAASALADQRASSTAGTAGQAAASSAAQRLPCQFGFAPVDAPNGCTLRVAVEYAPAATVALLEQAMTPAQLPAAIPPPSSLVVIHDYVPGGPPPASGTTSAAAGGTAGHGRHPSTAVTSAAGGRGPGLTSEGSSRGVGILGDRGSRGTAAGAGIPPLTPGSYNPAARVFRRAWSSRPQEGELDGLEGERASASIAGAAHATGPGSVGAVVVREVVARGHVMGGGAGPRHSGSQAVVVGSVGGGAAGSSASSTPRAAATGRPPLYPASLPTAALFVGVGSSSNTPRAGGSGAHPLQGGAAQLAAAWATKGAGTAAAAAAAQGYYMPAGSLPMDMQGLPMARDAVPTSSLPKTSTSRAVGVKSGPATPAVLMAGFQPVSSSGVAAACQGAGAAAGAGDRGTDVAASGTAGGAMRGTGALSTTHQQQASAPLSVPLLKATSRNWSEADMAALGLGEGAAGAAGAAAAAAAMSEAGAHMLGAAGGALRQQLVGAKSDGPLVGVGAGSGGGAVGDVGGSGMADSTTSTTSADMRRLAPSSAPAAPRGMLGLALCAQRQRELAAQQQQQQQQHEVAAVLQPGSTQAGIARNGSGGGSDGSGEEAMSGVLSPCGPAGLSPDGTVAAGTSALQALGGHAVRGSGTGTGAAAAGGAGAMTPSAHIGVIAAATAPAQPIASALASAGRPAFYGGGRAHRTSGSGASGASGGGPMPTGTTGPLGVGGGGAFPLSCSPQLPFAFTPSATPGMSLHNHFRYPRRVSGPGSGPQHSPPWPSPSPSTGLFPIPQHSAAQHPHHEHAHSQGAAGLPIARSPGLIAARDISSLAIIRRPSWREHSVRAGAAGGRNAAPRDSSPGRNPWSFSASSFDVAAALAALPPVLPPGASGMYGGYELPPGRSYALPDTSLSASMLAGHALGAHGGVPGWGVPGTPGVAGGAGALFLPPSLPTHGMFPFPFSPPTPRSQQQLASGGSGTGVWPSWLPPTPLALLAGPSSGERYGVPVLGGGPDKAEGSDMMGPSSGPLGAHTALLPALPPVLVVDTSAGLGGDGPVSGPLGLRLEPGDGWGPHQLTGVSALSDGAGLWELGAAGHTEGAHLTEEECEGDVLPFVLELGGPLDAASVATGAAQPQLGQRLSAGAAAAQQPGGGAAGAAGLAHRSGGSSGNGAGAGASGAHQLPVSTVNQLAGMLLGREADVGAGVLVRLLQDAPPLGPLLLSQSDQAERRVDGEVHARCEGGLTSEDAALSALLGTSSVAAGPQSFSALDSTGDDAVHGASRAGGAVPEPFHGQQQQQHLVSATSPFAVRGAASGGDVSGLRAEPALTAGAAREELGELSARLRAHLAAAAGAGR